VKFPERGSSQKAIDKLLRDFESSSGMDGKGLEKQLTGSYDLTGLTEVRELVSKTLIRFMEAELKFHSPKGMNQMAEDIVSMTGSLWGARNPAGLLTSGGTESNFIALYVARSLSGKTHGSVILPATVHPSLFKACDYLGLKSIRVSVGEDFRADPRAIADAIRDDTIAIAATCGVMPWGTIDPIVELGEIAHQNSLYFHVDAAWGGYFCPWLRELGYDIPEFGFRVKGVSSVSSEPHKRAFSLYPCGTMIFRDKQLLDYTTWQGSEPWTNYKTSGLLGTRPGSTVAVTWALFNYLGAEGYRKLTEESMKLTEDFIARTMEVPGLKCATEPKINVANIVSESVNMGTIKRRLKSRGWSFYDILGTPLTRSDALAVGLVPYHRKILPRFFDDLNRAVLAASP
jgi:glutamate/tyrosine decarboxylase-like PLP-dependent enzyme